jgi:tyrosyl-DNA phosphodiesterase 2
VGTHTLEKRAEPSGAEVFSHIDTSRRQKLSLVSWNIDAFSSRPVSRAKLILSHILEGPKSPDIIFLQGVTPDIRASLLDNARVRAALLVTDAEDQTSFEGVPLRP